MAFSRRSAGAAAAVTIAVTTLLTFGASPASASSWWSPVALQGTDVRSVAAEGGVITVVTSSGAALRSTDNGRHFALVAAPVTPQVVVTAGQYTWSIDVSGRILRGKPGGARLPDPGSPNLGRGAHLLAAPAALPGAVVAVATDGTVWRRGQDGDWRQALLLLPQSLVQGVPKVTSVAAFTKPVTDSIYVATAGYSVLSSLNGGDDWIRSGPGLPDTVNGLAADNAAHSVYAATNDGLWVHTLQPLPAPARYSDQALVWRWLGIGAVTLVASVLALLLMLRVSPARRT
ncbi:MAG: hypothetical protein JOZ75_04370 [Candidatus Dormibacteraeota bacterium]|nr:hypothetical protein [Candidatus Dormibacteraeota bacterium]